MEQWVCPQCSWFFGGTHDASLGKKAKMDILFCRYCVACNIELNGLVYNYDVQRHFQQYFSYIVAVSFIGGGNRSTPEKTTALGQGTDKLYNKCFLYTKAPVTR